MDDNYDDLKQQPTDNVLLDPPTNDIISFMLFISLFHYRSGRIHQHRTNMIRMRKKDCCHRTNNKYAVHVYIRLLRYRYTSVVDAANDDVHCRRLILL